ncbi:Hsp33 family molecular chaperone HslO [Gilvimarinus sp. SDUM040013]|uniref:33 kDa chaperonin n=1 Tax=Gilvimarinus gilvus TaxID=3058038 RepID=A0ABU4RZF1_9GAMM|nr:Hsp33 family molecular chaperone HslO [Gilvimarinus sp. SDUM040013]MDO3388641.1 Hsp33 family molecular chaperone HslO [Gilvimarinus sp. SDUM040013]MDX6849536.1 Hsp33 family molecular chaperone HslO [Gilvimarinus sp. SDUM040013]
MTNSDLLHRFLFDECDMRGEIVSLEQSYQNVLEHNIYPEMVQRLLGEFLTAASLLSSTLKFDGIITLQAKGVGPVSLIMAECTHHNALRGIVRLSETVAFPEDAADLPELIGQGILTITVEPAKGERYQGVVPLDANTLAECLEHYFYQSEQLKTRIWLQADAKKTGGILLQALPTQIVENEEVNEEQWHTATTLADTVKREELLDVEHNELLYRLFHEFKVRVFSPSAIRFECSCSRKRSVAALKSLGRDDVEQLLIEQGTIAIDCQFCNQVYRFDASDVRGMFGQDTLH